MQGAKGAEVSNEDIELAVRMGIQMMNEGQGLKVIKDAINQSRDPGQVIGHFLAQIMAQMAEKLQKEFDVDPKIFLAKGGWLEHMLDYLEKKLGYPSNFSDKVYSEVVEVIKAAAQGPEAPNNVMDPNAAPPPAAQENVPQGGPPQDGGVPPGGM
jgi:hypothetical protein